jgi:hypothetical protein
MAAPKENTMMEQDHRTLHCNERPFVFAFKLTSNWPYEETCTFAAHRPHSHLRRVLNCRERRGVAAFRCSRNDSRRASKTLLERNIVVRRLAALDDSSSHTLSDMTDKQFLRRKHAGPSHTQERHGRPRSRQLRVDQ